MCNNNCCLGSEWNKWDLHLHTPSSYDYKDMSVTNEQIINVLSENGIRVAAITDHHVIDIDRIKELQRLGKDKAITILPGIEFLSGVGGRQPVHFIGIFSEDCDLEYVWDNIRVDSQINEIRGKGRSVNEIYNDIKTVTKLIHDKLGGIVSVHAGNKSNSIENITRSLPHGSAQKTDIANNIDIYELGNSSEQQGYIDNVFPNIGKYLPTILCSDNHNINDYQLKDNCWIKADVSFDGLKQTLIEPDNRVYLGTTPPILTKVKEYSTRFIKSLEVTHESHYDGAKGVWFKDISVPFSPELTAIIGNKGSGKSALADIIALCSNVDNGRFSFLNKEKFCKDNLADNFFGTLQKHSPSEIISKNLGEINTQFDSVTPEIKYIPQHQFEMLTNEVNSIDSFNDELNSVIFSHIPETQRNGADSFEELIEILLTSNNDAIDSIVNQIELINEEISKLEGFNRQDYLSALKVELDNKKKEYEVLTDPEPIHNPVHSEGDNKDNEQNEKLINLQNEKENLQKCIATNNARIGMLIKQKNVIDNINRSLGVKINELHDFVNEQSIKLDESYKAYNIDLDKVIEINFDEEYFKTIILSISEEIKVLQFQTGISSDSYEDVDKSLYKQLSVVISSINEITSKLNVRQKEYQEYKEKKQNIDTLRAQIKGNYRNPYTVDTILNPDKRQERNTINDYLDRIDYIENKLNHHIESKNVKRNTLVDSLLKLKFDVISRYEELSASISSVLASHESLINKYNIKITSELVINNKFIDDFCSYISHNRKGAFSTRSGDPKEILSQVLVRLTNAIRSIESSKGLSEMLMEINAYLHEYKGAQFTNEEFKYQFKAEDCTELYNYIFSLDYITPQFKLKQDNKELDQLSPGERGALLLVFYLLLDNSNIPLVIDQPEDNLDNFTVANILVDFIKKAKLHRQIIMVTHNPNLAVVADAEQIIHVNIDKNNNNQFEVISGSIENKVINKKIVDVLEGTMPAFNNRKSKYYY